jgi:GT2 family glycosyltransferase
VSATSADATGTAFPLGLELEPVSRRPIVLERATVECVLALGLERLPQRRVASRPDASIVVVTFNGLVLTRLCLESLLANTADPTYEVVVVDNGSGDGTRRYLADLAARLPCIRLVLNDVNLGFPAAVNQGLAASRGDVLVLLNNDTIVPPGWLQRLVPHLQDDRVGMVAAVTNRSGTEAEVDVRYRTYGELLEVAAAAEKPARTREIRMPPMFCVGLRRDVFDRVGPLDERYEVGNFEDEDYAVRCRAAGFRLLSAEDVFVHHFGEGTFGALFASGQRGRLFERNRRRFEEKWNRKWEPSHRPASREYRELRARIREAVTTAVPEHATLAVVSRGDDDLLELGTRTAWHFPQATDGRWDGRHPATSGEAISELEEARVRGAEFLLLPATSFWWLDHYDGFRRHLEVNYRTSLRREDACVVFSLETRR